MITKAFILIIISFIIGGSAIILKGIKSKDLLKNKERWIKYFIYLGIVQLIVLAICYHDLIRYISPLLVGAGLMEVFYVWKKSGQRSIILFMSLFFFLIVSVFFIGFSFCGDTPQQLLVYLFVFLFDGFSQITGQLVGKHKLSPRISPHKTIEGACGGFISVLLASFFIVAEPFNNNLAAIVLLPLLIGLLALSGDLLASYFKRLCHVKDYSKLIPAHGGVLDRFDSFIFSGAVYWFLFIL
jgi:phosphatidate cytidylyltransferase